MMSSKPSGRRDATTGPLLSATGLGRRLDGGWLWRDLDLTVEAGRSLAIVGPTGAGKSMLLRALAALDELDEGEIVLDGRPLDEWQVPEYRSSVVYLQQRPALWEGTVEDNLRAVFDLARHRSRSYDGPRVLEWLSAFGRGPGFLRKDVSELSGGEAQIGALIRALSVGPRVLMLDEPSASMDAEATRQAEALIRRWIGERPGRACLWTSHDSSQIERVADTTLTLDGDLAPLVDPPAASSGEPAAGAGSSTAPEASV